jgi:HAD superfamily hydrolase (TIGR01450 family)
MTDIQNRLQDCQAIVCDLDGTLYLNSEPFTYARPFLRAVIQSGRQLFYFTNNSSQSRNTYLHKLEHMGFPVEENSLITSTDCAIDYLNRYQLKPNIYLVGNKDLESEFQQRGFHLIRNQSDSDPTPNAVVLGFDTELTYEKIQIAYTFIMDGTPYIATHADLLCPVSKGEFKPDVGSFIALFKAATGKTPIVTGKPSEEAVQTICKKANLPPENIAFVGDRLYTDIRMASRSNMIGILVLSGETTLEMAQESPDRATIVVQSVETLIENL